MNSVTISNGTGNLSNPSDVSNSNESEEEKEPTGNKNILILLS